VALAVLLVDDNPHFLRSLADFLSDQEELSLEVVGAVVGGRDAVARAARIQPAVILLDLSMPEISGWELLPLLRATVPSAIIILLSAQDPAPSRTTTLAAGAAAFVSKASLEHDLLPAIRAGILRHQSPQIPGGPVDQ
jgi:DNA-binding NarL/FixJ family response regulator